MADAFSEHGDCVLYKPKEGKFERNLGDFSGSRFLANSGNWFLVLDSESNLYITDVFSKKTIPLPSLESIWSTTLIDSSIAVTTSGEVLLVESDPWDRSWFRIYKKDPDIKNPDCFSHTVLEVDSLGGEALLLDLGFTVPANEALGVEPDCIYFTRHYRPCQCAPRDLDICVFNLASKTLKRFPLLDDMNLVDARWFLPGN